MDAQDLLDHVERSVSGWLERRSALVATIERDGALFVLVLHPDGSVAAVAPDGACANCASTDEIDHFIDGWS